MSGVSAETVAKVARTYGTFFQSLSKIPADKCASDVLNEAKVHEKIRLFCCIVQEQPESFLPGKRMLEIGSGFCVFLAVTRRDYGIDSFGVEPASDGFDSSFSLGQKILAEYGYSPDIVKNAPGEALPWPDSSFDLVYSTNVLEHTMDPDRVVKEAVRVLKPGGYAQFIYPNYATFYEGHYALPWLPRMPKSFAKAWVRLWGRDPSFIDTLQFLTEKDARRWAQMPEVDALDFGRSVFEERMTSNSFSPWAGLGLVKRAVNMLHTLGIAKVAAKVLLAGGAYTPIILTLRKL